MLNLLAAFSLPVICLFVAAAYVTAHAWIFAAYVGREG